jgi:hypothetical protein
MTFSRKFVRRLVRYRSLAVAVGNAGVTWVVLIIAPLGLFAVIVNTAIVFCGSLGIGWLADWALGNLLEAGGWDPAVVRGDDVAPVADPQRERLLDGD